MVQGVAIILGAAGSYALFGVQLTPLFSLGVVLVLLANALYGAPDVCPRLTRLLEPQAPTRVHDRRATYEQTAKLVERAPSTAPLLDGTRLSRETM